MSTVTVDPGGGADYTSIDAAINALPQPFTENEIIQLQDGTADTTRAIINIATGAYTLTIRAVSGEEALKTGWSTSRGRLSVTDNEGFYISGASGTVIIENLQVETIYSSVDNQPAIAIHSSTGLTLTLRDLVVRTTGSSTYIPIKSANLGGTVDVTIENCILLPGNGAEALSFRAGNSLLVYNDVHYGNGSGRGYHVRDMSSTIKNSAIFNFADDFFHEGAGSDTIDYCASDDGDGTNAQQPGDWTAEYDAAGRDFTLLAGGDLEDAGVGPGTDGNVPTTDIDGTTRAGANCDIGADEIAAAGGISIPIVMLQHNHFGGGLN